MQIENVIRLNFNCLVANTQQYIYILLSFYFRNVVNLLQVYNTWQTSFGILLYINPTSAGYIIH